MDWTYVRCYGCHGLVEADSAASLLIDGVAIGSCCPSCAFDVGGGGSSLDSQRWHLFVEAFPNQPLHVQHWKRLLRGHVGRWRKDREVVKRTYTRR